METPGESYMGYATLFFQAIYRTESFQGVWRVEENYIFAKIKIF